VNSGRRLGYTSWKEKDQGPKGRYIIPILKASKKSG
jgi:hypothetical protein